MARRTLFDRLLDASAATEEMDPRSVDGGLLEAEEQVVAGAASTRIEQFTAGRVCARLALGRLGVDADAPIPQGVDRAPVWPDGLIGSITHTGSWCGVAVARRSDLRAVGIDLEPATPLKEGLLKRICTPTEFQQLATVSDPGLTGKVVFSAKEAVYKCQYPLTHEFLGFHAVSLELGDGVFQAVFQRDAGEFREGDTISGRYLIEDGIVATACALGVQ